MAKRFIITELETKEFVLVDKKDGSEIIKAKDFDKVFTKAKEVAGKEVVYGITNIKEATSRHPKFKNFKTPVRCSYEFE